MRTPLGNPPQSNVLNFVGLDSFGCQFFLVAGIEADVVDGVTTYYSKPLPRCVACNVILTERPTDFWQWTNVNGAIVGSGTFPQVTVTAGQELFITVSAVNPTSAVITMRQGPQNAAVRVVAPDSPLCLSSPGWFVYNEMEPPLADFGTATYAGARATFADGGETTGPTDPRTVLTDILRNGALFTNTAVAENEVRVRYTQPA